MTSRLLPKSEAIKQCKCKGPCQHPKRRDGRMCVYCGLSDTTCPCRQYCEIHKTSPKRECCKDWKYPKAYDGLGIILFFIVFAVFLCLIIILYVVYKWFY